MSDDKPNPVIPAGQLRTGAERIYAPLGFPPEHVPSSGALQVLTDDLRAYYGDAVMLGAGYLVEPVITWRLNPIVMRLHDGKQRRLETCYVFCTPLVGPLLDLVWYVQGAAMGSNLAWQWTAKGTFIYHHSLKGFPLHET